MYVTVNVHYIICESVCCSRWFELIEAYWSKSKALHLKSFWNLLLWLLWLWLFSICNCHSSLVPVSLCCVSLLLPQIIFSSSWVSCTSNRMTAFSSFPSSSQYFRNLEHNVLKKCKIDLNNLKHVQYLITATPNSMVMFYKCSGKHVCPWNECSLVFIGPSFKLIQSYHVNLHQIRSVDICTFHLLFAFPSMIRSLGCKSRHMWSPKIVPRASRFGPSHIGKLVWETWKCNV